jgi:type II secretory pathway pseudopilin PulG
MHLKDIPKTPWTGRRVGAFTLAEVVMAIAIVAIVLGGMTVAYTQATRRAQWSGYSLAAQALAIQQLEQARAGVWDPSIQKNELTNLNLIGWAYNSGTRVLTGHTWANLDLPISGTNFVRATNFVTVSMINLNGMTSPPVQVQMVRVDTVWPFRWGNTNRYFTNSISTYCAPDNRDPDSL